MRKPYAYVANESTLKPVTPGPKSRENSMWDQRTRGYIPRISLFFNNNI